MEYSPQGGMPGVVEGLLSELRQTTQWIDEIRTDLEQSEQKRVVLAQALDRAIAALEAPLRDRYSHRIKELLGDIGPRRTGRPPADDRQEVVIQQIAEWVDDAITTTEIRLILQRRGLDVGKNYVSNLLKRLEKRGMVLRTGHGRYKVTRLHPELFARRHGIRDRIARSLRKADEAHEASGAGTRVRTL